ncbi:hypothetical protein ACIRU3_01920 [Streptomyces sp. NPDC101151]|uniref:hypothetical protein n=1 Tax=Streptomyces sp. NPDC101151 TaxID=3366115 RepID=UPI00381EECCC
MRLSIRLPLAALLATAAATGCTTAATGEKAPGGPAAAAVARAARNTEAVPSLRYLVTGRMPEPGRVRIEGRVGTTPSAARVKLITLAGADAGTAELRLVDGHVYQSMSKQGVTQEAVPGKHWIDFGTTGRFRSGGGLKMDVGGLRDQAGRNPAREAAFLGAAEDIHRVGTETVDRARTTHYTGTVTVDGLRGWLKGRTGPGHAGRKQSLDTYAKMGVLDLTLDVWIDGRDRVKRQRVQGFGRHGELDLTATFSEYGTPVTVEKPSAGDTVDIQKPPAKGRG